MSDYKKESFYDKYFLKIWYAAGYIIAASLLLNSHVINKVGWFLPLILSFGVAVPIAFSLYTIYIFFSFAVELFIDGVTDKELGPIFAGMWILVGLIYFILGGFGSA